MADVEVLADPAAMTTEERTDELLRLISLDDLLGVLLVLYCMQGNEIDGVSRSARQTPLESAISLPTRHAACRRLIVECLLLHGARFDRVLHDPPRQTLPGFIEVLQGWRNGGKEAACEAASLLAMDLEGAESYIEQHGLLPDDVGEHFDPADTPPIPSTSSPIAPPERPKRDFTGGRGGRVRSPRRPAVEEDQHSSPSGGTRSYTSRRRSRPTRSPEPTNGLDLPVEMPTHWLFVGNIPLNLAERYIYETLHARGIQVGDVFMSRKLSSGRRFAYVGFYASRDVDDAVMALNSVWVHGARLLVTPFRDPGTDATTPRLPTGSHILRRYIGPQRQANRPRHLRHTGLFLLHLHPETTQEDVFRFVRHDVPRETISSIKIKNLGLSTVAFVDSTDEEACHRAILNLDGRILRDVAVRVGWQELAEVHAEALQVKYASEARVLSMEESRSHMPEEASPPLAKRRRRDPYGTQQIDGLRASRTERSPSSSSTSRRNSNSRSRPADNHRIPPGSTCQITAEPTVQSTELTTPASAISTSRFLHSPIGPAEDITRLHSLNLTSHDLHAIERIWLPSNDSPSIADRSVEITATFGSATKSDAVVALEANRTSPAFPNDQLMQRQYESFLRSQAGMGKEWYMAFLTQLVDFNRTTELFVSAVRNSSPAGRQEDERP